MSDTDNQNAEQQQTPPQIQIRAQYLKDLSFENPQAPKSIMEADSAPDVGVSVKVNATALSEVDFEVELEIQVEANRKEDKVFIVELLYAGIFTITNAPKEYLEAICMIECPRFLFPYARQILSDATREGGFPPLMLDPVDFAALYQQQSQAQAAGNA